MKSKLLFFFTIFYFFSLLKAYAIPRCEELYNTIYNDPERKDVNRLLFSDVNDIGILLKKRWNDEKEEYELLENKDGYFIVGKITKSSLYGLINEGDVITKINNLDLKELSKNFDNYIQFRDNIADFFEENAEMTFHILKSDKIDLINKDIYDELIINTKKDHDFAYIDFFINSIDVNEKDGFFIASLQTDFSQTLDENYFLSKSIWKHAAYDKKYKDDKLETFWYERCLYSEDEWNKLNTVDPFFGIEIQNLIKEEKNLRDSTYVLQPSLDDWYYWFNGKKISRDDFNLLSSDKQKEIEDTSEYYFNDTESSVTYKSKSVYKIKNDFNLKSFPFDSQKIQIFIINNMTSLSDYEMSYSFWSEIKAQEFKEKNDIQGWDIKKLNLKFNQYYDPISYEVRDGVLMEIEIDRKSIYYLFKIILPIILILVICWSSVWIDPKEIESRLTITIVCLLSLIAYNFVIDSELPKLEYLTVMDYIILVSYIYATIPNFLAIISFNFIKDKNKKMLVKKIDYIESRYGLLSYIMIILLIVIVASNTNPEHSTSALTWASAK